MRKDSEKDWHAQPSMLAAVWNNSRNYVWEWNEEAISRISRLMKMLKEEAIPGDLLSDLYWKSCTVSLLRLWSWNDSDKFQ